MKTFADRLNAAMQAAKISQGQLAEKIGISQPAVQKMTIGKTQGSKKIVLIANALGVRPEWLATGKGAMNSENEERSIDYFRPQAPIIDQNAYRVEVLDLEASAGNGAFISCDFVETIRAIEYTNEKAIALFHGLPSRHVKVITVRGDSMEDTISSGDTIFVNIDIDHFTGDGIYVFVFGQTLHVKRLQMQKNRLAVISDNKAYETWYIDETDQEQFHVIAKVLLRQSIDYKKFF